MMTKPAAAALLVLVALAILLPSRPTDAPRSPEPLAAGTDRDG